MLEKEALTASALAFSGLNAHLCNYPIVPRYTHLQSSAPLQSHNYPIIPRLHTFVESCTTTGTQLSNHTPATHICRVLHHHSHTTIQSCPGYTNSQSPAPPQAHYYPIIPRLHTFVESCTTTGTQLSNHTLATHIHRVLHHHRHTTIHRWASLLYKVAQRAINANKHF